MWFKVKKNWISNFSGDNVEDIMKEGYNFPMKKVKKYI